MSGKLWRHAVLRGASRGQGVIEYAGALVIAAVLVSLAIFVVPPAVAGMHNNIMASAINFFTTYLPGGA